MAQITARDKELAKQAWSYVEKDYAGTGMVLFKELFSAYPDYVKFFDSMKANPNQDIFESARFKKHMVSALFPAIAQMLKNLDNPDQLNTQLQSIGVNHKRRKLTRQNFEAIQKIIILTFKKALGDKFNAETEAAWYKILSIAFDKISTVMEKTEL